jgi:hypothetical protein
MAKTERAAWLPAYPNLLGIYRVFFAGHGARG